jgi:hypothetical protein
MVTLKENLDITKSPPLLVEKPAVPTFSFAIRVGIGMLEPLYASCPHLLYTRENMTAFIENILCEKHRETHEKKQQSRKICETVG